MDSDNEHSQIRGIKNNALFILILVAATIGLALWFKYYRPETPKYGDRAKCQMHLKYLGLVMHLYASNNDGKFPPVATWCDALMDMNEPDLAKYLQCPTALEAGDTGRCHYAMNPNAAFDSDPNVVLLFESKGGWNQYGGRELMVIRHDPNACNVLLVDGRPIVVRDGKLDTLNWGMDKEQMTIAE